ncbi:hypothetical protein HK097_004440 [Rhizophlyctis rosea]|uniref:Tyrosinase copper-binding domain-containing protein n=1 Tax=Rhizophlyctis rosea TaxID=64517 RepID=A0AAD5X031_9FUNG|nr:hypothetical protein HK097_004440 [Rhizophlyctis rosea]
MTILTTQTAVVLSLACLLAANVPAEVSAAPAVAGSDSSKLHAYSVCKKPLIRKEWRNLKKSEQKSYLNAVLCLAKKPTIAKRSAPGAISRYDDFVGVHAKQTPEIHFVGYFLHWHRYFVHAYEKALREECGYKGAQPYWDYTYDVTKGGNMTSWPLFDKTYGFGGNGPYVPYVSFIPGRTGGGCVQDGPFTYPQFSLSLGPAPLPIRFDVPPPTETISTSATPILTTTTTTSTSPVPTTPTLPKMTDFFPPTNLTISNPHCLKRDFAPQYLSDQVNISNYRLVLSQKDFASFAFLLEGGPFVDPSIGTLHGGGHFGVGGSLGGMSDPFLSPSDPVFYMHHTNLDRVWWKWQKAGKKGERYRDVAGPIVPFDYQNTVKGNVTLDYVTHLEELGKGAKVRDLMDTKGGFLCYDYEEL